MSPPDCRNSKTLTPGVPTVDLRLAPVLSRNFHLAFLLGVCHTMESHLFWEGTRPLFATTKEESLTLAEPGTPQTSQAFLSLSEQPMLNFLCLRGSSARGQSSPLSTPSLF